LSIFLYVFGEAVGFLFYILLLHHTGRRGRRPLQVN